MQHALLPRPQPGLAPGAGLALLVHAGLIAALTLSVDWRMKSPEVVSAELWAALPQTAAPKAEEAPVPTPAPPPPPPAPAPEPAPPAPAPKPAPPPDAQIATERPDKRRPQEERKTPPKPEPDRKKLEAEQQKAEDLRLAQLRDEQMKRMLGSLGTGSSTSTGTASQDAAPSQAYVSRLIARIKQNVVFNDMVSGNPAAEVEVRSAPNGTIIARRLIKGSGNKDWDDAVLRAIDRTGTLPRDTDGRVPATIIVAFRPKE